MNQKYRGLYFLGVTLGVGLLIIGGMKVFSTKDSAHETTIKSVVQKANGHQALENKIKEFSKVNFSPEQYNSLLIEINSGAMLNLFNQDIKNMLLDQLNLKYRELALERIGMMVRADPINLVELNNLMSHFASTFGPNKELNEIKSQIKALNYYTQVLPRKVNSFVNQDFANFNGDTYTVLINELDRKINLDEQFKRKRSVIKTQISEVEKLKNYYIKYLDWSLEMTQ